MDKNGKNGTKMAQNPKIIEFYPKNAQKYPKNSQKWPKNAQNSVSFLCRFCVVFWFVSFFSRFLQIFTSLTNTNFSQVLHKKWHILKNGTKMAQKWHKIFHLIFTKNQLKMTQIFTKNPKFYKRKRACRISYKPNFIL